MGRVEKKGSSPLLAADPQASCCIRFLSALDGRPSRLLILPELLVTRGGAIVPEVAGLPWMSRVSWDMG
jgi:hypothetical protein